MTLAGPCAPLLRSLSQPESTSAVSPAEWSRLLSAARSMNLLGTLAERLHRAGTNIPAAVVRHLDGARQLAARQRQSVLWEVHSLQAALEGLGVPVVLLKGSAYVIGNHPVSVGRMFGDIDVLVPRDALGEVESALMLDGWVSAKTTPYDQRYYRQWMHELPPMVHVRRGAVVDIHHTILPPTSRHSPDPAGIIERAAPVAGLSCIRVPSPEDLVIHSITHLVHEGELHNGLRDLVDIDTMLRGFSSEAGFWQRFTDAAIRHDLTRPVSFGLALARRTLATPIPAEALQAMATTGPGRGAPLWLQRIYDLALQAPARNDQRVVEALATALVYIRAHWLRMPPGLLARHLATKAWMGWRERPDEASPDP
jgi:hypothetical protein